MLRRSWVRGFYVDQLQRTRQFFKSDVFPGGNLRTRVKISQSILCPAPPGVGYGIDNRFSKSFFSFRGKCLGKTTAKPGIGLFTFGGRRSFGTAQTKAAVYGNHLNQHGWFLLGNKTAELIKENLGCNFLPVELINAVQTRSQTKAARKGGREVNKGWVFLEV
ncbi:hypothetical protein TNCV_1683451 [Trichonephila clavipes]|nr:hypothetical protein TNCV_1683451 [Trichonephila clavipes]